MTTHAIRLDNESTREANPNNARNTNRRTEPNGANFFQLVIRFHRTLQPSRDSNVVVLIILAQYLLDILQIIRRGALKGVSQPLVRYQPWYDTNPGTPSQKTVGRMQRYEVENKDTIHKEGARCGERAVHTTAPDRAYRSTMPYQATTLVLTFKLPIRSPETMMLR